MPEIDPIDLAWAACAIDCEGCIGGYRFRSRKGYKWVMKLNVTNTDPRLPRRMQEIFGVGAVSKARRDKRPNMRPSFEWSARNRGIEYILRAVLPYLVIKREQAEVALAIIDTMQKKNMGRALTPEVIAEREAMVIQLKSLKRLPIQEVS